MKLICESATGFEVARGRSASRQTFGLSGIDRRRARRVPYATRPRLYEVSWIQDLVGACDHQHRSAGSFNLPSPTNPS